MGGACPVLLLGGLELQQGDGDDDGGSRSRAGGRRRHQDLGSGVCWDVVPFLFPFMERRL